jgi:hypothetical protein
MLQPGSTMVARAKHSPRSFDEGPLCECQGKGCALESRGLGGLGTWGFDPVGEAQPFYLMVSASKES